MKAFRKAHGVTYPLLLDEPGALIQKFGFTGIPQDIVINTDGKYVSAPQTIEALNTSLKKLIK